MANYTNYSDYRKRKDEKTKRQPNVMRGVLILAAVGVGCGVYGFIRGTGVGYKAGYHQGVKDGALYMTNQLVQTVKEVTQEQVESKGE